MATITQNVDQFDILYQSVELYRYLLAIRVTAIKTIPFVMLSNDRVFILS